jgi:hypothetical protein
MRDLLNLFEAINPEARDLQRKEITKAMAELGLQGNAIYLALARLYNAGFEEGWERCQNQPIPKPEEIDRKPNARKFQHEPQPRTKPKFVKKGA